MFRIATAVLTMLVSTGLQGCADGPRVLEMPPEGELVTPFPPALNVDSSRVEDTPLQVTLAEPQGAIVGLAGINIGFSQPMVETTGVLEIERDAPATITPNIVGKFRWLGPRTLSFVPSGEAPMATTFHVKLAQGLQSLGGQKLAEPYEFSFHTPELRVVRYDPSWYAARLQPDDTIFVQFNLPVRREDLAAAARLLVDRAGQKSPVEFSLEPSSKDRSGDALKDGVGFSIVPQKPLQPGATYVLRIEGTLAPSDGELTLASAWERTFTTYGDFEVRSVRCGYGECRPHDQWVIEFSNPVAPVAINKCVSVQPPLKMSQPFGYGATVTLSPGTRKPGTDYVITVDGKCRDKLGNTLGKTSRHVLSVGHFRPSVTMASGVNFMEVPADGESPRLPLTLQNVADARVRMTRLDEGNLAKFLVHFNSWSADDLFKASGLPATVDRNFGIKLKQDQQKTYGLELDELLDAKTGLVFVDLSSESLTNEYSYSSYRRALIQISDIGVTTKTSPESVLVWTTSLATAEPLPSVQVSLRTEEGKVLWTDVTDNSGIALGPGLDSFGASKPRVLIAKRGEELSFLDLESWRTSIEPYRFGLNYDWDARAAEVRGFIFTERGVYRPGESVHVKGYLRYDRGKRLEKLPVDNVSVTVTDAHSDVILVRELKLGEYGSFDLEVPLAKAAKLGTYSVVARPNGLEGSGDSQTQGSFRVEAYRAPDFEVNVRSEANDLTVGDEAQVAIAGQYLFGAPMVGAEVRWYAHRAETSFRPTAFRDYVFGAQDGRWWWSSGYEDTRGAGDGTGKLDDTGLLHASVKVEPTEELSGPQVLTVEADVTDINRQVISARSTVKIHPGSYYIGIHQPGYLVEANKPFVAGFVAVDPRSGQGVVGKKVEVNLLQRTWTSVKKAAAGGGYTWISEKSDVKKAGCVTVSKAVEASCTFDVPGPGYYVIEARSKDEKGRSIVSNTGIYAWGGGYSWWGGSDDERLDLVVDKESYGVGDVARVMVKSPFRKARALVTVERRGIISQRTVELEGSASMIDVPITDDMLPNAFVSVVAVRGRVENPKDDGTTIDPGKPSFKMGYATLNVDKSRQVLDVSIEPEAVVYQPGETVRANLSLRDSSGSPVAGEVTFMAVDEGVLSLTGYVTPNPVDALFRAQPIAVRTAETRTALVAKVEMADEEGMKGDSGGGGEGGEAQSFRSAFATTAAFMPAVVVGASGNTSVEFLLPDNLTAFRLMAVAVGQENRFGSGETRVTVQKPLMVRPALPRFASTTDTFDVRVVVQTVGGHEGKVEVRAEARGSIELTGTQKRIVDVRAGKPVEVKFPGVVGSPGDAKFRFVATAVDGFEGSDSVEMTIPVKFPAVTRSVVESGTVKNKDGKGYGTTWRRIDLPDDIRADTGSLDIELSASAMSELLPGLHYLVGYPYGCVEQTTGRTLPLVAMTQITGAFDMPGIPQADVKKFAQSGVDRLFTMQTPDGGLGYWPGDGEAHPWGSAYGGLALVRASTTDGLTVDEDKLDKLLDYLRGVLRGEVETPSYWSSNDLAVVQPFASYVLALAGAPEPSYHELMFENRASLPDFGKALLALAIIEASGPATMVDALVSDLLAEAQIDGAEASLVGEYEDQWWMSMHSSVRSSALALMVLMQSRPNDALVGKFARGLLRARKGSRWMSTQENAFAILALTEYFDQVEAEEPDYYVVVGLGEQTLHSERIAGRDLTPRRISIPMKELAQRQGEVLAIMRDGKGGPLYYTIRLNYVEAKPPTTNFDNGFTLMREYLSAEGPDEGQPVGDLRAGQLIAVRLTLVVPEDRHYVALEDPLPSGLEPVNTSFATSSMRESREVGNDTEDDDWWWYPAPRFDYIEQLDDRVLLFADDLSNGVYTHTYLARATTIGKFSVPSARVEEMYDPETYGRSDAFTITVR
jgi:hypothetical protein